MKTVEEACKATFVYEYDPAKGEAARQVTEQAAADMLRWHGIDQEVRKCEWVRLYIGQMIGLVISRQMPLQEALFATAAQMVQVGVLMASTEELPDPTKSVPGRRDEGYTGI